MTKIQNYKRVYDLEEKTLKFAKQGNDLKTTFSAIIGASFKTFNFVQGQGWREF